MEGKENYTKEEEGNKQKRKRKELKCNIDPEDEGGRSHLSRDHETNVVIQSMGVKLSVRDEADFADIDRDQGYQPLVYPKQSRNLFTVQLFLESKFAEVRGKVR